MSNPAAKIFINGKEAGMTPYRNNSLKPGEMEIRLINGSQSMVKKISLINNVNTVVDWTFGGSDAESGGYLLSMEKIGGANSNSVLINTSPSKATIAIDDEVKGFSPAKIEMVGDNDKKVTLSFPGYKSINVFVKSIKGYQLIIDGKLSEEKAVIIEPPSPTPGESLVKDMVTIKSTETGWLRVRSGASNNTSEIAKVKPGEKYEIISEKEGWVEIKIDEKKSGWISASYADKL